MSHRILKLSAFIAILVSLINVSSQIWHKKLVKKEQPSNLYNTLFEIFDHLDSYHQGKMPTFKIPQILIEADIPYDDDVARNVVNRVQTKHLGLLNFGNVVNVAKTIIKMFDNGMTKELGSAYLMMDKDEYMKYSELSEIFFNVYPDAREEDLDEVIHEIFTQNCKSDQCTGFMKTLKGE